MQQLIDISNGLYVPTVVVVDSTGVATTNNTYSHISTSTTTLVKTGAGYLKSICISTKGSVASTITVYDALTAVAPVIAVIDSLNLSGTFTFDVAFSTGLTIVTTGTVPPDITVSYH